MSLSLDILFLNKSRMTKDKLIYKISQIYNVYYIKIIFL